MTFRIVVQDPLPGVELRLQRGRDELVPPIARTSETMTFELRLDVQLRADRTVQFRGAEAQGPAASRFVYINAGTYAGQDGSPWGRRAKVSLMQVDAALIDQALAAPSAILVATIDGRGRDGGPAAASVPLLDGGWCLSGDASGG